MSQAEARQLLVQRVTEKALLDDSLAIEQLLSILACLPLAIVQAAAFINSNETSVSEYVSLFKHAGAETQLFSEQFEDPSRYEGMDSTIAKTWHISFAQIRRQDPLAAEYLAFIACIDRINVPQSLLPSRGFRVQQIKALGTLTGYALITERQQTVQGTERERFFDMHRLVYLALVAWLQKHGEWAGWVCTATNRLSDLLPYGGHKRMAVWEPYLPHAISIAACEDDVEDVARASLLGRVGRCQESLGQYASAEASNRQALLLRNKELGREHPSTLTSMSNLALVLSRQGKYEEAEVMNRQTLAGYEKVLGHEHPSTLTSMNNLANVLDSQGKYEEAEAMHRQELALSEKVLGHEHPDTLMSMNNLARVLDRQGKYEEAEAMNRQTLVGYEKVLGHEHPSTLTSMNNLAGVLVSQGKYEEAEAMHRQTLAWREKVLRHKHPDTLASMNNLAGVLVSQGKYEEAEAMHRQTLAWREKVLGHEHPDTLTSMNNLALVLDRQGKSEEAEAMHRQTLARRERVLGHEHPDTLASVYSLAHLLTHQHRYNEALALYDRASAGYHAVLGKDHPTTRACHQQHADALALQEHD